LVSILLAALGTLIGLRAARRARRRRHPARVAVPPRQSTVISRNGAVRSVQSAELTIPQRELERLWTAPNLENLGRTYWRFLSRVTLGLIRVVYGENERAVVLLARPLTLLRFEAPDYELRADHGTIRWRIRDGLLVARRGRHSGFLSIDVRRLGDDQEGRAKLRIKVQVANFYPAIATSFSMPFYEATQSSIHVLVTHAFLRSLANLRLAKSKVGRLAALGGSAVTDASEGPQLAAIVPGRDPPHGP
jgi:hypothetical protein